MTRLYYYRGGSSKSNLWSEDYLWTRLIQSYRFHLCDHVPWSCQRQNFLDDQRWSNGLTDNCNLAPWHLECTYFQLFFVGKSPSPGEWRWVNWVSRVEGISLSKNHSVSPAGKWKPWELNYVHIAPKKLVCIQVTYFVQFSFVSASECKAIWIRIWIRCVREEFRAFCILHMWLSIQWCFKNFNVHSTSAWCPLAPMPTWSTHCGAAQVFWNLQSRLISWSGDGLREFFFSPRCWSVLYLLTIICRYRIFQKVWAFWLAISYDRRVFLAR